MQSLRSGAYPEGLDVVDEGLTAFDESLRNGGALQEAEGDEAGDDSDLAELKECVRLLNRAWPSSPTAPPELPSRLGKFEIERVLGYGGFGIVYLATDPVLQRQVALKVPRIHTLVDERLRDRFRREARAAASLDHPNIVPIYETGTEGGVCYLASTYCPGPNLAEWLQQQTAAVPARLAATLVARLAEAVQYSHAHGVLHRDLKPGNVLLVPGSSESGTSSDDALPFVPRLTDFGLARLLDDGLEKTAASTLLGTPIYMAPEQTSSATERVGPTADVYGLGMILYELLAGRPPFQAESFADILDQLRHTDPVPLHRLRKDVPRDLEIVCLKCLEKSPRERYATARELAEDLQRFLRGEPLVARPPGWWDLALKWGRRRPLVAALAGLTLVVAVGGPAILISHNRQLSDLTEDLSQSLDDTRRWRKHADEQSLAAKSAARDAEAGRNAAEAARDIADLRSHELAELAYASSVRLAELAWREGDTRHCRAMLSAAARHVAGRHPPGIEWHFLDYQTRTDGRELGDPLEFYCSAISPDGRTLAAGGSNGIVQMIELPSGVVRSTIHSSHDVVRDAEFNTTGDRVALAGDDGTVSIWSTDECVQLHQSPGTSADLYAVAWLADDEWIAFCGDFPSVKVWKPSAESELVDLDTDSQRVASLATSRKRHLLASGGYDGIVRIWNVPSQTSWGKFPNGVEKVTCLVFTRNGDRLIAGGNEPTLRVYRLGSGVAAREVDLRLRDEPRSLVLSPSDNRLAVLEKFGTLRLFTLALSRTDGRRKAVPQHAWVAHDERGFQVARLPDASGFVSVGRGNSRPRLWSSYVKPVSALLAVDAGDKHSRLAVLFAPDSQRLIVGGARTGFWSPVTLKREAELTSQPARRDYLALSRDGRRLATGSVDDSRGCLEIWDASVPESPPLVRIDGQSMRELCFSPDSSELAVADWSSDAVVFYDAQSGQRLRSLRSAQCRSADYSPDGRFVVVNDLDDVVVWSTESWSTVQRLRGHLSSINSIKFSPDGRWLASTGNDRQVLLWRADDWTRAQTLQGHRAEISSLAFTSDSRSLVVLDRDSVLKVWHPATGLEMCNLRMPTEGRVSSFAISLDGNWLALRREDGGVELRRLRSEP